MSQDYLDWLTAETDRAFRLLQSAPYPSPKWIMTFHRLEVLDECARQYKKSLVTIERRQRSAQ